MTKQQDMAIKIKRQWDERPGNCAMSWFYKAPEHGTILRPTEEPTCGTVLCIAGWAAHLGGWTLGESGYGAWKGLRNIPIEDAGAEELDMEETELFFAGEETAKIVLDRMAAGEVYSDDLYYEVCTDVAMAQRDRELPESSPALDAGPVHG